MSCALVRVASSRFLATLSSLLGSASISWLDSSIDTSAPGWLAVDGPISFALVDGVSVLGVLSGCDSLLLEM